MNRNTALKTFFLVITITCLLTACPYQSDYVIGEKAALDTQLIGTFTLDSSKFIVDRLVFKIDANSNFTLNTFSKADGKNTHQGTVICSSIGKTKILNLKSNDLDKYYYIKYEVKPRALQLSVLSKKKFEITNPNSKQQLDSAYTIAAPKKKLWAFNMRLKKKK